MQQLKQKGNGYDFQPAAVGSTVCAAEYATRKFSKLALTDIVLTSKVSVRVFGQYRGTYAFLWGCGFIQS